MPGLYSPQQSAGVMSFYDAPTNGPKIGPKVLIVGVILFTLVIMLIDHFVVI